MDGQVSETHNMGCTRKRALSRCPNNRRTASPRLTPRTGSVVSRSRVGVMKRSTVSTAQLRASLPLHLRPINLVVYQGSVAPTNRGIHTLS